METLSTFWKQTARPAEREEILAMPLNHFLDRDGNIQEPFLNDEIELFYIPDNNEALEVVQRFTSASGCLKQTTRALLINKNNIILGIGANAGKKLDYCPRVKEGCSTGEGYHHCRNIQGCHQIEHAEIMALLDAVQKKDIHKGQILLRLIQAVNNVVAHNVDKDELAEAYRIRNQYIKQLRYDLLDPDYEGLDLVLDGHWWACHSCTSAFQDAGVTNVYLREKASELFDSQSPDNILPKFHTDGTLVK